jgi:hypothetical protein
MADLYTTISGLTPTAAEIQQAELLAQQILQAQFPDLDLRLGTGLRDLTIRPTAYILALVKKGLDYYFVQNTLQGVDDTTPTEVVDDILSNWFLTRNTGTYAVISARLYFARAVLVSIPSTTWFSPDNTLMYYPQSTLTIPAASMSYDSFNNVYYVDVTLQADTQGTQYNLAAGALLYFQNFSPYFLNASINYLVTASTASETNTQFITRAATAISTRNLINTPSIISNLQQEFNYITQCLPVGYGDAEMLRDEIRAVFIPETPRTPTALTSSSNTATATLDDHGWYTGQIVFISGAVPDIYNGEYTITVLNDNQFTYQLLTPATAVTTLPTIQSVTEPVWLHTGGCIDIYCDSTLTGSVVQLTTDSYGNATLVGPIYSFSRSSVSGGSADDTIPFSTPITTTSTTVDGSAGYIEVVTSSPYNLTNSNTVEVSGLIQTLTITAISCTGILVTVTSASHGLTGPTSVVIAGVTPTAYNGTYTVNVVDANTLSFYVSTNIATPGSGSPMTMTNPSVTGDFGITVSSTTQFNVLIPALWANGTNTGTITLAVDTPYTITNPNILTQQLTSLTCAGTTVTGTLQDHGLITNRYVTISGATPTTYNGQWLITSIPNANQFTYTVPATIGSAATGTLELSSVLPTGDVGFSADQTYVLGFGATYANETASFSTNYFENVQSIQAYLQGSANRILCADLLARGFNFYILDLSVVGYSSTIPDSGTVQTTTQTYLTALSPGAMFIMSDLVAALETAGVTSIQTPLGVTYTKYTRDLITPITGTITDYLDPNDRTNVFLLGSVTTSLQVV